MAIYKCQWCKSEITHLETDGDEVFEDFICPECAEADFEDWKKEVMSDGRHMLSQPQIRPKRS